MGIILSTGCSNTLGVDLEEEIGLFKQYATKSEKKATDEYRDSKRFSTLIGEHFNRRVVNLGHSGSSNDRIIKTTIDYLEKTDEKVDLVLINLSAKSRFTFQFYNKLMDLATVHDADFYAYNWPTSITRDRRFFPFYEYFRRLTATDYSLDEHQTHMYRYIILYLEQKGIPYIISPTIHTGVRLSNLTHKCIDISFDEFNHENGRKRAKGNHWLSDSHKAWAELLIEKLEDLYDL